MQHLRTFTFSALCFLSLSSYGQWSTNGSNIYFNSGNVGFGTSTPGAKISFADVAANTTDGIAWHAVDPVNYGIYRTSGSWSGPNYQQLNLQFVTGIILEPGNSYGKSFVDVRGGGLRVTSGNVGIGTTTVSNVHGHDRVLEVRGAAHSKIIASSNNAAYITAMYSDPNWSGLSGGFVGTETNQNLYLFSNHAVQAVLTTSGSFGIGTTSPLQKLDVRGNLLLENSSNPTIYTGTGTSELNRYLWLLNSPNAETASGLKAGGVLVSDNYYYASPGKNDLIVKGNVGIGTPSPGYKLQVVGGAIGLDNDEPLRGGGRWLISGNSTAVTVGTANAGIGVRLMAGANDPRMIIDGTSGNVGIGTLAPDAKLSVKGQIHAQEVKVDLNGAIAPDYVFNKDYNLPSLDEIKSYIEKNNHLPEVPSAKEMEANGMNLGEMNLMLLKKVEELTLYIMQQEQRIKSLEDAPKK